MSKSERLFLACPPLPPPKHRDENGVEVDPFEAVSAEADVKAMNAFALHKVKWVSPALEKLIAEHQPAPTDFDSERNVVNNMEALEKAAREIVTKQPTFVNIYQCAQTLRAFAGQWGFFIATNQNSIVCHFGGQQRKKKSKVSTPERRHKVSHRSIKCTFCLSVGVHAGDRRENRARPFARVFINVEKCCFQHSCEVGLPSLVAAKKRAGQYQVNDLKQLGDAIKMITPETSAHQIRQLLKGLVPRVVNMTSTDIHNLRVRALKYKLENHSEMSKVDASNICQALPLDENEAVIRNHTDRTSDEIRRILKAALCHQNEANGHFVVKEFLNAIKRDDHYFDYNLWMDPVDNRPIGVAWITRAMREKWIRFGSTLNLDAMKRRLNVLDWKYMAVTVSDQEKRVGVVMESLLIEESLASYSFLLNSLFRLEPNRSKETVALIFGDCALTENLLPEVGLSLATTKVVWDCFHLMSKVFPDYLKGDFRVVENDLRKMVFAKTRTDFEKAYDSIVKKLQWKSAEAVEYVKSFYDAPHRFAKYAVRQIPGNLDKNSSQTAESNHASVLAHGSRGSTQKIEFQIENLLEREQSLISKHSAEDTAWWLEVGGRLNDNSLDEEDKKAMSVLSRFGFSYWQKVKKESENYNATFSADDNRYHVQRIGREETSNARAVPTNPGGERCNCPWRLSFVSLCPHECSAMDGKFDAAWFSPLLKQSSHSPVTLTKNDFADLDLPNEDSTNLPHEEADDEDGDYPIDDDGHGKGGYDNDSQDDGVPLDGEESVTSSSDDDEILGNQDGGRLNCHDPEDEAGGIPSDGGALVQEDLDRKEQPLQSSEDDSEDDDIPLMALGRKDTKPGSRQVDEISYRKASDLTTELARVIASHRHANLMYGAAAHLLEVGRENLSRDDLVRRLGGALFHDGGCSHIGTMKTPPVATLDPTAGPLLPKPASSTVFGRVKRSRIVCKTMEMHGGHQRPTKRKKTRVCGFCGEEKHTVAKCLVLRNFGVRVPREQIVDFRKNRLGEENRNPRPVNASNPTWMKQQLSHQDNKVLEDIPPSTTWLVLHAVHNASRTSASCGEVLSTRAHMEPVAEVTLLDRTGKVCKLSERTFEMRRVIIRMNPVIFWVNTHCKAHGSGKTNLIDGNGV